MNSFVTKPLIKLNNWAKHLNGRMVSDKKIAFSSRIRQQLEDHSWVSRMKESRATIFGQGSSPFDEILKQHGAKAGDIVLLDAHTGEAPRSLTGFKTDLGKSVKTNFEKGTLKVYTPNGELKTIVKFSHNKPNLDITKFSPAGSWIGKRSKHKL